MGVRRLGKEILLYKYLNIKYLKSGSKSTKKEYDTILKSTPQRSMNQKYIEEMCQDDKFMH